VLGVGSSEPPPRGGGEARPRAAWAQQNWQSGIGARRQRCHCSDKGRTQRRRSTAPCAYLAAARARSPRYCCGNLDKTSHEVWGRAARSRCADSSCVRRSTAHGPVPTDIESFLERKRSVKRLLLRGLKVSPRHPLHTVEARAALLDMYRTPKAAPDRLTRQYARGSATSAHIALTVLPIPERRDGDWIDYDVGRPFAEHPSSSHPTPRSGVFNLGCLIYRLPGKPLGLMQQGSCFTSQPSRLEALYNLRELETTYRVTPRAMAPQSAQPQLISNPQPWEFVPWEWEPYRSLLPQELDPGKAQADPELLAFTLFTLFEAHGIKE